jgi:nucleoside-diphosphate-sugar epimerase
MEIKKERFFIVGGFGYIGSAFAIKALKQGHDVFLFDSLIHEQSRQRMLQEISADKQVSASIHYAIGDTRNVPHLEQLIKEFKPTYVMQWGELSSVYSCNHNPAYTEEVNCAGTKNVLDICERLGLKVFYNSSSSVYGVQKEERMMTEADPLPEPTDKYCYYKLKIEDYVKDRVAKNPNFKIIVFRPATIFGVSPRFRIELLPNHFTYLAIAKGIIRIADPDAYRAGMDVKELVEGYFKVIENGSWNHLIYNIGHFNMSKIQFAEGIKKVVPCDVGPAPDMGDRRNLQIDCSLFNNEFDFHPSKPYEESIQDVAGWIQENRARIEENNFAELLNMPLDRWHKICN